MRAGTQPTCSLPLLLLLLLAAAYAAAKEEEQAGDGGCVEVARPYLSKVPTVGMHVVCIQVPPPGGDTTPSLTAHVFRGSQEAKRVEYVLGRGDGTAESAGKKSASNPSAVHQLLAQLSRARGASWRREKSHLSVGLFNTNGNPVLTDQSLLGAATATAPPGEGQEGDYHVAFAFDGGRFLWPPISIGHVWEVPMAGNTTLRLRTLSLRPAVFAIEGFLS
jgi:hypothetical protein